MVADSIEPKLSDIVTKNIKSIFITLPQRGLPSVTPPFGAMAVINSLRKAGYKDTSLYNIDVLRPSREDAIDYIVNYNRFSNNLF